MDTAYLYRIIFSAFQNHSTIQKGLNTDYGIEINKSNTKKQLTNS